MLSITPHGRRFPPALFTAAGIALIVALWEALSSAHSSLGIVPSPSGALSFILSEARKAVFWRAVGNTLYTSVVSFSVSFAAAALVAAASRLFRGIKLLCDPLIVVCRAMPTAAVILILLLCVNSRYVPVAVAFLVVFPLCYENLYHALETTDGRLLEMAAVFKISLSRRLLGIYLPAVVPAAFSSIRAGAGLNLKVVIAAEILGLPSVSIGYSILSAKQSFAFSAAFAWLVVAVILCFVCEAAVSVVERLCMPWQYGGGVLARLFNPQGGIKTP
jgi:NitT/TauT family transport system permease protein